MRQNRHCLVKFWKSQKVMSIFPHKAKAILQLFCLQPIIFGWRQNSFSGVFVSWGRIKVHYFRWADQDWIGLMIFNNFANQSWIGLIFIGSGLDSTWKISQSAHLCFVVCQDRALSVYITDIVCCGPGLRLVSLGLLWSNLDELERSNFYCVL